MFKNLIQSEFLLLSASLEQKSKNFYLGRKSDMLVDDTEMTLALEISELVKKLKQFIRILRFLKNEKEDTMVVHSSVKSIECFLTLFAKKSLLNPSLKLEKYHSTKPSKKVKSVLILGPRKLKSVTLKRLVEQNILLINQVNSLLEATNTGTYKICNDLVDVKKLIFLMTLINAVLKHCCLDQE